MHQTQRHPFILKKKTLMALRAQTDTNTVTVWDLSIPLSPIDRSSRQKIYKITSELLQTLGQIDTVDIYRVFYPKTRQYTLFSAAHGTFSKINHILGHNASLKIFKRIFSCIISDHNRIKEDLNKMKSHKIFKELETKQHTAVKSNAWMKKYRRNQKVPRFHWKWKHNLPESVGHKQRPQ
jgi:hypothetical protein